MPAPFMRLLITVLLSPLLLFPSSLEEELKNFLDVYLAVREQSAEAVDNEALFYQGAIPGMLRRLDPHSVFFDPGQFNQLKRMQTSTEKGFGTVVNVLPGRVIVLQTFPGTPSARSGMEAGDEIVGINNIPLNRLEVEQIVQLLGQARQQTVQLTVRRQGNARLLSFQLDPQEMDSPSVDRAFLLRDGVGYIRIKSFDRGTGRELKEKIDQLGGRDLKGLVLDLRDNPGGMLASALESLSLFLPPGTPLLSIRGRTVEAATEAVPAEADPFTFPVAVLVNGKSASAAEVMAGALQDHDRAWILGAETFGKGLVERVFPLSGDTGLALTTSFYYTPSGRSIQRPLKEIDLSPGAFNKDDSQFLTVAGRKVEGGGGIRPDRVVLPERMTPLRAYLEASGVMNSFVIGYLREHADLAEDFEVTAEVLDEFQGFLAERNIQPSLSDWSRDREWIANRLLTEIMTHKFGVAKGDEVEARRDEQVLAALEMLPKPITQSQ